MAVQIYDSLCVYMMNTSHHRFDNVTYTREASWVLVYNLLGAEVAAIPVVNIETIKSIPRSGDTSHHGTS